MNLFLFALAGYLLGSLPFAVIVSRAFALPDPRTVGSKNPGATNVLRSGNKAAAVLTLLGDAVKGWAAMQLVALIGANELGITIAGMFALLGHVFPLFLRFKGGKGVATALGVLAGFSPMLALVCVAVWLGTALMTRYSSLAAVVAAVVAPGAAWWLGQSTLVVTAVSLASALLIVRHRANLHRLTAGTETRIGAKSRQ